MTRRRTTGKSRNPRAGLRGCGPSPALNNGVSGGFEEYDVTPQDYYTIYNVNKVFNANANVGRGRDRRRDRRERL